MTALCCGGGGGGGGGGDAGGRTLRHCWRARRYSALLAFRVKTHLRMRRAPYGQLGQGPDWTGPDTGQTRSAIPPRAICCSSALL